jgi:hypothetical protein
MSWILNAAPGQVVTIVFEQLLNSGPSDGYREDGYFAGDTFNDGYNVIDGYADGYADGFGADGYYDLPLVNRIIFPSLSEAVGYPKQMARLDTGLYYFQFTLPTGAAAVGTYIVDIKYVNPNTENWAQLSIK